MLMKTENMKFPLGPRVMVSTEGLTSLKVSMEEDIISFQRPDDHAEEDDEDYEDGD